MHFHSTVFCDFGTQFSVLDATGETPLQGMIVSIVSGACSIAVTATLDANELRL